MSRKVLAVMDAFWKHPYSLKNDSTHLLLLEFKRRKFEIYLTSPEDLKSPLFCNAYRCIPRLKKPYFILEEKLKERLSAFDLILMRKDPPVNARYLKSAALLCSQKDRVINNPSIIQKWSEKTIILNFPQWIPPTLVTRNRAQALFFLKKHSTIVLKPLHSYAGKGVKKISRTHQIPKTMKQPVMFQKYLSSILSSGESGGEKRIFMIDGQPLGALLKTPAKNNFLANPDLGARLSGTYLSQKEKKMCRDVGVFLKKKGIFFAGIDVIDECLTEINFTSPGLLWEWNKISGKQHEKKIVDLIIKNLIIKKKKNKGNA